MSSLRKSLAGFSLFCALVVAQQGWGQAAPPSTHEADTLVVNAKIYTVNPRQPWAEALALADGKILAVGRAADVERFRGKHTQVIDAKGHLVLPGFADCHVHFEGGSFTIAQVHLAGLATAAEIQDRVKKYIAEHPGTGWVLGRGWAYSAFGAVALPDKKLLDAVVPDRPALLTAYDGHTTWANSKALALAGITRDTPNPPNGIIVRDPQTGEATGALKERASQLVRKVIPELSREEKLAALQQGLAAANRVGVVRVHSAGGDFADFDLYDELRRGGKLTVRMYISYFLDPPELTPQEIEIVEQARKKYTGPMLSAGVVKTMVDGVIESHTAAMLTPYSDDPSLIGKTFWEPAKYKAAVAELDRRGFQVFTHAIGEAGVRLALDAYEAAAKANGARDARHRIEHIETVSPQDIPRFGSLGVIASMQPLHANPDDNGLHVWARNAGPERTQRAFAWQSIARSGGRLAYGSDWPVVTINPWEGVQCAVTRQTPDGQPPGGWVPDERVTLAQAIEAYTIGAAFAGHREQTEGSLEPDKVADLVVVDQNVFETEPHKIGRTQVLLTLVGGKIVYQSPAWARTSSSLPTALPAAVASR
jgi:predicted amidohydrolase YtcJ